MSNPTLPSPTIANTTTLSAIETKVRRLTRSPSTDQLSQADLDNYINTSVVYDFPETLRTFNLRTEFTFFTNPGQDQYNTDITSFAGATTNPLYNFQNQYLTIHPPFYIAGFPTLLSQSPEQFYGLYPKVNSISSIGTFGNGSSGPFTGVINTSQTYSPPGLVQVTYLVQGQVLFSAVGTPGTSEIVGMAMVDIPVVDPVTGFKINIGNLYDANSSAYQAALRTPPTVVDPNNNINYITGAFIVNFPQATVVGTQITSQTLPQVAGLPQSILYYSNIFTIRPIPDQSYRINFEVYQRPTALLASNQSPELEEYWQYIAYLAAKKIFEDRSDLDSVQLIMPELKNQERLCLRRTNVQYTNERTATIYTDQVGSANGNWGGWGNPGGF